MVLGAATLSLVCFAVAGLVWFAQQQLEDRQFVEIDSPSEPVTPLTDADAVGQGSTDTGGQVDSSDAGAAVPVETFPQAEPSARNYLITGADNNACVDPDSRFAPAFGDRSAIGERSDTIMMWRINPSANAAAILSFPRDLWVDIDGRSSPNRINSAYETNDPTRLINTIRSNFGIDTDHYVQVDFCAFKTLVDAVDGVAVPFETPVRDIKTGLFVPDPGCFRFDGEHALAYVRSRQIEFFDEDGEWQKGVSDDRARISRQQDFIERVVDELLANRLSPSVVRSLFEANREFVVTDDRLTVDRLLEFAGVVQQLDSSSITAYQIQASARTIAGNSVLIPQISGPNMQAILAIFQGRATLADAVEQEDDEFADVAVATTAPLPTTSTTTTTTTVPTTTVLDPDTGAPVVSSGTETSTTAVTTTAVTTTTIPPTTTTEPTVFEAVEVEAEETVFGIVPDGTVRCP